MSYHIPNRRRDHMAHSRSASPSSSSKLNHLAEQPTLANLWDRALTALDQFSKQLVKEARHRDKTTSQPTRIESALKQISDALFQLRIWGKNLALQGSEKFPAAGSLSVLEILKILETFKTPSVELLGQILRRIEASASSNLPNAPGRAAAPPVNTSESEQLRDQLLEFDHIQESIVELEKLRSSLNEEIADRTDDEMREALLRPNSAAAEGSSALSLDGGGIRSYSSLLILQALMNEIQSLIADDKVPSDRLAPAKMFDYIFGSSSGGILATALGRLAMTESDCLTSFSELADEVLGHRRFRTFGRIFWPKYSDARLVRAMRRIARDFDPSPEDLGWRRQMFKSSGRGCKTSVITCTTQGDPHIIRSYECTSPNDADLLGSSNLLPEASRSPRKPGPASSLAIWEVARATLAAPTYFSPFSCGDVTYVDGGLASNNPAMEALMDIISDGKHRCKDTVIVSIGTGVFKLPIPSGFQMLRRRSSAPTAHEFLLKMATDTEITHHQLSAVCDGLGIKYFRFNVDSGLENILLDRWEVESIKGKRVYKTFDQIEQATDRYLEKPEVKSLLVQCAESIVKLQRSKYSTTESR